jgi:hypothetical protein
LILHLGCQHRKGRGTLGQRPLDHDYFGLILFKIMNVADFKSLERDAGGKPVSTSSSRSRHEKTEPG